MRAQVSARRWTDAAFRPTRGDAYRAWHKINYDRQHNGRMLASDDPDYATALDVRLLYGLDDVFTGYFAIRNLRWEGEKSCRSVSARARSRNSRAVQAMLGRARP